MELLRKGARTLPKTHPRLIPCNFCRWSWKKKWLKTWETSKLLTRNILSWGNQYFGSMDFPGSMDFRNGLFGIQCTGEIQLLSLQGAKTRLSHQAIHWFIFLSYAMLNKHSNSFAYKTLVWTQPKNMLVIFCKHEGYGGILQASALWWLRLAIARIHSNSCAFQRTVNMPPSGGWDLPLQLSWKGLNSKRGEKAERTVLPSAGSSWSLHQLWEVMALV